MFKPVTLADAMTVYSLDDPAIDWNATLAADELKRAKPVFVKDTIKEAMRAPSVLLKRLKFKPGETPCRFTIGVIPSDVFTRLVAECGENIGVFWWVCFLHGVRDLDWPEKPAKHMVDGVEYVDPVWLKSRFIRNQRSDGTEIGSYVLAFNKFEEAEARL